MGASPAPAVRRKAPAQEPAPSSGFYLEIYRAAPVERISMIKKGVQAKMAKRLFADLSLSQAAAHHALKISTATVNRKAAENKTLSPDESERVLGVAKLIGQVEAMVQESGEAEDFDATAWLSRWLQEPVAALDGLRPVELMDTMEGQALVASTLEKMQTGAYA